MSVQDIAAPEDADIIMRRAYWHSRRGMAELEQQLLPFLLNHYASLSPQQQGDYNRLLEHEDWEIFDWLQGKATAPDAALAALVERIQSG